MRRRAVPTTSLRRRNPLRALLIPLATIAVLVYFAYNTFTGALGVWSLDSIEAQAADLSAQLADLQKQSASLETQIKSMSPESLDADLVDSTARAQLSLMRPDEVVIGTPLAP